MEKSLVPPCRVYDVQSSFYTNNPLLYLSHLSDVLVHTGCNAPPSSSSSKHSDPAMFNTQLSTRRELVEQLDSEPLFDYLVQNGVLDETGVDDIRNEKSEAQTNLALLKHLELQRPCSVNLFINALRQTGQHQLANTLDNSKRINPAPGSGEAL